MTSDFSKNLIYKQDNLRVSNERYLSFGLTGAVIAKLESVQIILGNMFMSQPGLHYNSGKLANFTTSI